MDAVADSAKGDVVTAYQIIGALMLIGLFGAGFSYIVVDMGVAAAFGIFGFAIGLTVFIYVACFLLGAA